MRDDIVIVMQSSPRIVRCLLLLTVVAIAPHHSCDGATHEARAHDASFYDFGDDTHHFAANVPWNIMKHATSSTSAPGCIPGADCCSIAGMMPPVPPVITGPSAVTAQLSPDDRSAFEHLLGQAVATTSAVQWATREFASRMRRIVVGAAAINGTSAEEALTRAFAPPWYDYNDRY